MSSANSAAEVSPLSLLLFNQAASRQKAGDLSGASALYLASVRADSRMAESWNNLGFLFGADKNWDAAIACCRKAVALRPDHAGFRMSLGDAFWKAFRMPEAKEHLLAAVRIDPRLLIGWYELAVVGLCACEFDDALRAADRALTIDPAHFPSRWIRALTLLASGDYERGFAAYECRLENPPLSVELPKVPSPRWNGESLGGKTLLLLVEQGYGDIIQFARFLRALPRDLSEIILQIPGNLLSLFERSFSDLPIRYVLSGQPLESERADYHIPLMSLPSRLKGIPPAPYLRAPIDGPAIHRPAGIRQAVGIAWAGNPKHEHDLRRSSTLEQFFSGLAIPGVELYSLQVNPGKQDPALIGDQGLVQDLGRDFKDFADTAFAIGQMDFVVSVDSAVAHLAGALGKPCHLLVPSNPDWRWGKEDPSSTWYPSIRIHRQSPGEGWPPVLERVAEALRTSF